MKKILIFFSLILFSISVVSCKDDEEEYTIYDELYDNLKANHPNGYYTDAMWYEFNSETTIFTLDSSEIVNISKNYIGYMHFNENELNEPFDRIYTTKFTYSYTKTTIKEGKITKYETFYACLNGGVFYCVNEVKNNIDATSIKTSRGCSNMEELSFPTDYEDYIFDVVLYKYISGINAFRDSCTIYKDHINFSRYFNAIDTVTDYYYDESYVITKIKQYKNITLDSNYDSIEKTMESTFSCLKTCSEIEINVPTEYDEEYTSEWANNNLNSIFSESYAWQN